MCDREGVRQGQGGGGGNGPRREMRRRKPPDAEGFRKRSRDRLLGNAD